MRIKDQPMTERPRERLLSCGPQALSPAELLAILLRTGLKGVNVVDVAKQMLAKFNTLEKLAKASVPELRTIKGVGPDKAVTLVAAFTLAKRMADEIRLEPVMCDTPEIVARLLREDARLAAVETFRVLLLNTRRRLMDIQTVSNGTLDTSLVHPREVFRGAIASNASAIIVAHNHPSGDPTPSEADIKVTRDLIRAGQLLKIELLDHVIVGKATPDRPKDFSSLRELGYFYS